MPTELVGVAILIAAVCKSFTDWVRKDPHVRLKMEQGIAIALDFKLGSEVLRTVLGPNCSSSVRPSACAAR